MTRSFFVSFLLAGTAALSTANCGGTVGLSDRSCPCADGYACCPTTQICVTEASECDALADGGTTTTKADAGGSAVSTGGSGGSGSGSGSTSVIVPVGSSGGSTVTRDAGTTGTTGSGGGGTTVLVDAGSGSGSTTRNPFPTEITPNIVQCGERAACEDPSPVCCGFTQSMDMGTCTGDTSENVCFDAQVVLSCDGPEDCAGGALCCGSADGFFGACSTTTGTSGSVCVGKDGGTAPQLCHDHTQCGGDTPNCCPVYTPGVWPILGICLAEDTVTDGPCDLAASK